jgi:DNA-binding XRE family transcriptional regulator
MRGKYMNKTKTHKIKNRITLYRRRMKFSQRRVAMLLGHRDSSTLCAYEYGRALPPLLVALRLGIILRIPVEFLFPELYESLKTQIRAQEDRMNGTDPGAKA